MNKARKFTYQKRDNEAVRERANMRSGDFDSIINPKVKVYKVRDGKNLVRILPPTWDDARHYGYDLWINYGIGVDNQSYLSLSKMKNEADPIAEAKRAADKDGDKDLGKALAPRRRIAMWVIDRQAEEEGPQLWTAPFSLDKDLANLCFDEDTRDAVMIDHPADGCDIRFYKEGAGLKTNYDPTKIKIMKPSPLHEDEKIENEWLDYIAENPVPECLQFYSYDHIAAIFDGNVRAKEKPEDDATPPPKRASREDPPFDPDPPRKTRRVEPDEDEAETPSENMRRDSARTGRETTQERAESPESDDDSTEVAATSIRDRLNKRRAAVEPAEDDEGEAEPAPRRRVR